MNPHSALIYMIYISLKELRNLYNIQNHLSLSLKLSEKTSLKNNLMGEKWKERKSNRGGIQSMLSV